MRYLINFIILGVLIVNICGAVQSCAAEQIIVQSEIETDEDLSSVVGVIFNSRASLIVQPIKLERIDKSVIASFPYDSEQIFADTMVYAMGESIKGEKLIGRVKALGDGQSNFSQKLLEPCLEQEPPLSLQSQMSTIEQLIKVRASIRKNKHQQMIAQLDQQTLQQIYKLEKGFGLYPDHGIAHQDSPYALIDRLSRLHDAVKIYRIAREKQIAATRAIN